MRTSILKKVREGAALSVSFFESCAGELDECVDALSERFERGGRLLVIGNGGSACDAEHAATEFMHPIIEKRPPLPAMALTQSSALMSAIGNDTDFARVFLEQLEILAHPPDALLAISTSGASANVNRALDRARELGLLRIGFSGRDGGSMVDRCDFCFVVPAWSIHRVQEVHTTLLHLLWDQLHVAQGEADVL
jgi:D-sedoheptulose 7-phosphate isomerase